MNGVKAVAKVVAATAAGALMLGATVAGAAFAADFGSFPSPFVKDGAFSGKIVVGANAATADVVGAIGIAAALGQATVQLSDATGTGKATVSVVSANGIKGDVPFNGALTAGESYPSDGVIRNSKFSGLHDWSGDSALKYKDTSTTIKAHQELTLQSTATIGRGIGSNDKGMWKVYMPSDSIEFKMVFDEPFNKTKGDLVFDVMGTEVTLEDFSSSASMTLSSGKKYSVSLDNPTFTDASTGATVTFKGVDTNSNNMYVTVTNGGLTDTAVLAKDTEKTVAGIALKASDLFRLSDTSMFGSVSIGSKLTKTINVNDAFLSASDWTLKQIDLSGSDMQDFILQYNPSSAASLGPGEKMSGLFGGFEVSNVGYKLKESDYYNNLKVAQKDSQSVYIACGATNTTGTKKTMVISWPKASDAKIGGQDVTDAFLYPVSATETMVSYHLLSDGTYKCTNFSASAPAVIELTYAGTTNVTMMYAESYGGLRVYVGKKGSAYVGTQPSINITATRTGTDGMSKIGQGQGVSTTVAGDIFVEASAVGDKDYDYWSTYGVRLHNPKVSLPNGEILFDVPNDQNKMSVIVGKETTVREQIGAGQTGPLSKVTIDAIAVEGAKTAIKAPISAPVAVLDTEVASPTDANLILVGGPSVNRLVKQLGGMYADVASYKDVGKLYWVENAFGGSKTAVVAAGWEADNTRAASYVLAHYDSNAAAFAGKSELTVSGKDVTSLTVQ
jgi:hypothetical protein